MSTPSGRMLRTCAATSPSSTSGWWTPIAAQGVGAVGVAGGGEHGHAEPAGEHGGRHPDRRGAAADQDRLAGLRVETDGERTVRRLQHLGYGAEGGPVEVAGERDDLAHGHAGVLGVAAVEGAAHAAHHRRDLRAGRELAAGAGDDDAGRLDAEHAREGHAVGEAEPGVQLGAVEPEGLDLDQHLTRLGHAAPAPHGSAAPRAGPARRARRPASSSGLRSSCAPVLVGDVSSQVVHGRSERSEPLGRYAAPSQTASSSPNETLGRSSTRRPARVRTRTDDRASLGFGARSHQPACSMRSTSLLTPPTVIDNASAMSTTRQPATRPMTCIGSNHDNGRS